MISSEVAEAIIKKLKDVCRQSDHASIRYIELELAAQIIMNCQYAPEPEANKIDFNHLHQWLEGVDKRLENCIEFNSQEFLSIQRKFRNVNDNLEQLTVWLNVVEKKVIEMKGEGLGRQAAMVPDGHNGYLTKQKPQREEFE